MRVHYAAFLALLFLLAGRPLLSQPVPGDVFREYLWFHEKGDAGSALRVGGKKGQYHPDRGSAHGYVNAPVALKHDLDLERSYMVGDWWSDIGAGQAGGVPSILVRGSTWEGIPAEEFLKKHGNTPDVSVDDLGEAVDWIIRDLGD